MSVAAWVWLGLLIAFIILEAATAQMVSIWFIIGSLVSFVFALVNMGVVWQVLAFIVVSVVCLLLIRPLAKKRLTPHITPTNADMNVGRIAVVRETVNNDLGTGRVLVDGKEWAARSYYGDVLNSDDRAVVHAIDGVKLIVIPMKEEQ